VNRARQVHFLFTTSALVLLLLIVGASSCSPYIGYEYLAFKIDKHFKAGLKYYSCGKYDNATSEYTEVIMLSPLHSTAYNNRGLACYMMSRYKNAIDDFSTEISLSPSEPMAYYNRGNVYSEIRDYSRAINDFDRAIQLNPNEAEYYIGRADAHSAAGKRSAAIADYKMAMKYCIKKKTFYGIKGKLNRLVSDGSTWNEFEALILPY